MQPRAVPALLTIIMLLSSATAGRVPTKLQNKSATLRSNEVILLDQGQNMSHGKSFRDPCHGLSFEQKQELKQLWEPFINKRSPEPFPKPYNVQPQHFSTGFYYVGCMQDSQTDQVRWYHDNVPKLDRFGMTPSECFDFCRNVSGALFFGLKNGDKCYCTPFMHNTDKGGHGMCDVPCTGDSSMTCGGKELMDVYEMHDCTNMPELKCMRPPAQIKHAMIWPSRYYKAGSICSNAMNEAITDRKPHCTIMCEPGYEVLKNDLQCVEKGHRLTYAWAEFTGSAACVPKWCGVPPESANSRRDPTPRHFGQSVLYTCNNGFSTQPDIANASGPVNFTLNCDTDMSFKPTAFEECRRVHCGTCPQHPHAEAQEIALRVYEDKCTYNCHQGYSVDQNAAGPKSWQGMCRDDGQFSALFRCQPIRCPGQRAVPKAQQVLVDDVVQQDSVVFPNVLNYQCDPGFTRDAQVSGVATFRRTCQADGILSLPPKNCIKEGAHCAICLPISCGRPAEVAHATHAPQERFYMEKVMYTCNTGYSLNGQATGPISEVLTCDMTGAYDKAWPTCQPIECGNAPSYANAQLQGAPPGVLNYESPPLSYRCDEGFSTDIADSPYNRKMQHYSVSCTEKGNFSRHKPCLNMNSCLFNNCGPHGRCQDLSDPTGTPLDDYRCMCQPGYMVTLQNMTPTQKEKICTNINDCPLPNPPTEQPCGGLTTGNAPRGQCVDGVLGYTCACYNGYKVNTSAAGNETCVPVVCGTVPSPSNTTNTFQGEVATYDSGTWNVVCDSGYTLTGAYPGPVSYIMSCAATGNFTPPPSLNPCLPVSCGTAPLAQYSTSPIQEQEMVYPETNTYSCEDGYSMTGQYSTADADITYSINCLQNGSLAMNGILVTPLEVPTLCQPVTCGSPTIVENAHAGFTPNTTVFNYPETSRQICDEGYSLDNSTSPAMKEFDLSCLSDGNFSDPPHPGRCIPVACPHLVPNPYMTCDTTPKVYQQAAQCTAHVGYTLDGTANGTKVFNCSCQANATFTPMQQVYPVSCGQAPDYTSKNASGPVTSFVYPNAVSYTCGNGYSLNGEANGFKTFQISCQADGTFETHPGCQPVRCPAWSLVQHTLLVNPVDDGWSLVYPQTVSLQCEPGWSTDGVLNSTQIYGDIVCQADGTLQYPSICSMNNDDCAAPDNMCSPDGTCVDHPNPTGVHLQDFNCSCDSGFAVNESGDRKMCYNIPDCPVAPGPVACLPGTCTDLVNNYTCNCPTGYYQGANEGEGLRHDCLPVSCGVPSEVSNANWTIANSQGAIVYFTDPPVPYTCHTGYTIDGLADGPTGFNSTCLANGTTVSTGIMSWTPPMCHPVLCGTAPVVDNSTKEHDLHRVYYFPDQVRYTCDPFFEIPGTIGSDVFTAQCNASGLIEGVQSCQPMVCEPIQRQAHTSVNHANLTLEYPQDILKTCRPGYALNKDHHSLTTYKIKCGAAGRSGGQGQEPELEFLPLGGAESSVCTEIDCGTFGPVVNGNFVGSTLFGGQITVTCDDGYSVDGSCCLPARSSYTTTCGTNGQFGREDHCQPVRCGSAPNVTHTSHGSGWAPQVYRQATTYTVDTCYTLDSSGQYQASLSDRTFVSECLANGTFSARPQAYIVSCGLAPSRANSSSPGFPHTACFSDPELYTCDAGHTTNGQASDGSNAQFNLTCQSDGTYSGNSAGCQPVFCGAVIAPPFSGQIDHEVHGNLGTLRYSQQAHFECDAGYTLNGRMLPGDKDFHVTCLANGSISFHPGCINIDDCEGNLCEPNGTCVDHPDPTGTHKDDYHCDCLSGFQPQEQEGTEKHYCGNIPDCPAGACEPFRCKDLINNYTCLCGPGYNEAPNPAEGGMKDCMPQSCGFCSAYAIANATCSDSSELFYDARPANFTCTHGHTLNSEPSGETTFELDCQASGQLPDHPGCMPVACSNSPRISSTDRADAASVVGLTYSQTVTYTCDVGHQVRDNEATTTFTATCEANGTISGIKACEPVRCFYSGTVPNLWGDHQSYGDEALSMVYQDNLTVTCMRGYSLTATDATDIQFTVQCGADGSFLLPAKSTCVLIDCAPLPTVDEELQLQGPAVTTDIIVRSDEPGSRRDVDTLEVDQGGRWKWVLVKFDIPPRVTNVESAQLEVVLFNGGHTSNLHNVLVPWDASSTFSSLGMIGQGHESTGVWDPAVVTEMGGVIGTERLDVTSSVRQWQSGVSENHGWIWEPTGTNGVDWHSSITGPNAPKLTIRFQNPGLVANGSASGITTYGGPDPVIVANTCYSLDGTGQEHQKSFNISCSTSGQFTGVQSFQRIKCGGPPDMGPGTAYVAPTPTPGATQDINCGGSAEYTIQDGYTLSPEGLPGGERSFAIMCQDNGTFTDGKPVYPVRCPPPPAQANADLVGANTSMTTGSTADYQCHVGYTVTGNAGDGDTYSRPCGTDGAYGYVSLMSIDNCLPVNCQAPNVPGNASGSTRALLYSETIDFTCNAGFSTDGVVNSTSITVTAQCRADGTTYFDNSCINNDDCATAANGCSPDGTCVDKATPSGTSFDDFDCACDSGYQQEIENFDGQQRKVCNMIDYCLSDSCSPGICHPVLHSHYCNCPPGYYEKIGDAGKECEIIPCGEPDALAFTLVGSNGLCKWTDGTPVSDGRCTLLSGNHTMADCAERCAHVPGLSCSAMVSDVTSCEWVPGAGGGCYLYTDAVQSDSVDTSIAGACWVVNAIMTPRTIPPYPVTGDSVEYECKVGHTITGLPEGDQNFSRQCQTCIAPRLYYDEHILAANCPSHTSEARYSVQTMACDGFFTDAVRYSLANLMQGDCSATCLYDLFTPDSVAYKWDGECWDRVSSDDPECFGTPTTERNAAEVKAGTFCEATNCAMGICDPLKSTYSAHQGCVAVSCGAAPSVANGGLTSVEPSGGYKFGNQADYSCDEGYSATVGDPIFLSMDNAELGSRRRASMLVGQSVEILKVGWHSGGGSAPHWVDASLKVESVTYTVPPADEPSQRLDMLGTMGASITLEKCSDTSLNISFLNSDTKDVVTLGHFAMTFVHMDGHSNSGTNEVLQTCDAAEVISSTESACTVTYPVLPGKLQPCVRIDGTSESTNFAQDMPLSGPFVAGPWESRAVGLIFGQQASILINISTPCYEGGSDEVDIRFAFESALTRDKQNFSATCGADGNFVGMSSCSPVKCPVLQAGSRYVSEDSSFDVNLAAGMTYGATPLTITCDAGYAVAQPSDQCASYLKNTGCGWTTTTNGLRCPDQPDNNHEGVATAGSLGFTCCCEQGYWRYSTPFKTTYEVTCGADGRFTSEDCQGLQEYTPEVMQAYCPSGDGNKFSDQGMAGDCGEGGTNPALHMALANKMFSNCDSQCVYDTSSPKTMAWKWTGEGNCWYPHGAGGDCFTSLDESDNFAARAASFCHKFCKEIRCGDPPALPNAFVLPGSAEGEISFVAHFGYTANGSANGDKVSTATCLATSEWSVPEVFESVRCPAFPAVSFATISRSEVPSCSVTVSKSAGTQLTLDGPGAWDAGALGGDWNDQISSMTVSDQCKAFFFEYGSFDGAMLERGSGSHDVPQGWNARISSIILQRNAPSMEPAETVCHNSKKFEEYGAGNEHLPGNPRNNVEKADDCSVQCVLTEGCACFSYDAIQKYCYLHTRCTTAAEFPNGVAGVAGCYSYDERLLLLQQRTSGGNHHHSNASHQVQSRRQLEERRASRPRRTLAVRSLPHSLAKAASTVDAENVVRLSARSVARRFSRASHARKAARAARESKVEIEKRRKLKVWALRTRSVLGTSSADAPVFGQQATYTCATGYRAVYNATLDARVDPSEPTTFTLECNGFGEIVPLPWNGLDNTAPSAWRCAKVTCPFNTTGQATKYPTPVDEELQLQGPAVTTDIIVRSDEPGSRRDGDTLEVDQGDRYKWVLVKFDIPPRVTNVESAQLEVVLSNGGHTSKLHNVLVPWDASSTFSSLGMIGRGYESTGVWDPAVVTEMGGVVGTERLNVTSSVRQWQSGVSENHGWIWEPTGTNGVDWHSSITGATAPKLTIRFQNPGLVRSYNESLQYTCRDGYSVGGRPDGPAAFPEYCQDDGTFTNDIQCEPTDWCSEANCGQGTCVNSLLAYSCNCDPGYQAVVQGGGYTCVEIDECTTLNGNTRCSGGANYGVCNDMLLNYTCDCSLGHSQHVDQGMPYCIPMSCGSLGSRPRQSSTQEGQKMEYLDTAYFECATGYTLSGIAGGTTGYTVTCDFPNASASEASSVPELSAVQDCLPVSCDDLPTIANSTTSLSSLEYPQTAQYTCTLGYSVSVNGQANAPKTFTIGCQDNGQLTTPTSTCSLISCGTPTSVEFASGPQGVMFYGDTGTYTCDIGHTIDGNANSSSEFEVTCLATGNIDGYLSCSPVSCGVPTAPLNSLNTPIAEQFYGDQFEVSCVNGYSPDGDAQGQSTYVVHCEADGQIRNLTDCVPVSCGAPLATNSMVPATNATPVTQGPPEDSSDKFIQLKRAGVTPAYTTIHQRGYPSGACAASTKIADVGSRDACAVAANQASSKVFSFYALVRTFECYVYPGLEGPCAANQWAEDENNPHADTTYMLAEPTFALGGEKFYTEIGHWDCKPGWSINGLPWGPTRVTKQCQANGLFGAANPTDCLDIDYCTGQPCTHNGICTDSGAGTIPPAAYTCQCQTGYEKRVLPDGGETCSEDDCTGDPCGNGTCTDLSLSDGPQGAYSCACNDGYEVEEVDGRQTCKRKVCGSLPDDVATVVYSQIPALPAVSVNTYTGEEVEMDTVDQTPILKAYDEATYTCIDGYSQDGSNSPDKNTISVRCDENGQFQPPVNPVSSFKCYKKACNDLPVNSLQNAQLTNQQEEWLFEDVASFTCDSGYTTDGEVNGPTTFTRTCGANGLFSAGTANCQPISCTVEAHPAATASITGDILYDTTTTYTCDDGHGVAGAAGNISYTGRCRSDGVIWSGTDRCEVVSCGVATSPDGTSLRVPTGEYEAEGSGHCDADDTNVLYSGSAHDQDDCKAHCSSNHECFYYSWASAHPSCRLYKDCPSLTGTGETYSKLPQEYYNMDPGTCCCPDAEEVDTQPKCEQGINVVAGKTVRMIQATHGGNGMIPAYATIYESGYPSGAYESFDGPSGVDECAQIAKREGATVFHYYAHARYPICFWYPDLQGPCPVDQWVSESGPEKVYDTTYMLTDNLPTGCSYLENGGDDFVHGFLSVQDMQATCSYSEVGGGECSNGLPQWAKQGSTHEECQQVCCGAQRCLGFDFDGETEDWCRVRFPFNTDAEHPPPGFTTVEGTEFMGIFDATHEGTGTCYKKATSQYHEVGIGHCDPQLSYWSKTALTDDECRAVCSGEHLCIGYDFDSSDGACRVQFGNGEHMGSAPSGWVTAASNVVSDITRANASVSATALCYRKGAKPDVGVGAWKPLCRRPVCMDAKPTFPDNSLEELPNLGNFQQDSSIPAELRFHEVGNYLGITLDAVITSVGWEKPDSIFEYASDANEGPTPTPPDEMWFKNGFARIPLKPDTTFEFTLQLQDHRTSQPVELAEFDLTFADVRRMEANEDMWVSVGSYAALFEFDGDPRYSKHMLADGGLKIMSEGERPPTSQGPYQLNAKSSFAFRFEHTSTVHFSARQMRGSGDTVNGWLTLAFDSQVVPYPPCNLYIPPVPPTTDMTPGHASMYGDSPLMVVCDPGQFLGGVRGNPSYYTMVCNADGNYLASTDERCDTAKFSVSGEVTDAQDGSVHIPGATVEFRLVVPDGDPILQQTVDTDHTGIYHTTLPGGTYAVTVSHEDYISMTKTIVVTSHISVGGMGDFALTRPLIAGDWRVVVEWNADPKDLDSHTYWNDDQAHVYFSRMFVDDVSTGVFVTLDRDDTDGVGPETTTFHQTQNCVGRDACLIHFYVKNYIAWHILENPDDTEYTVEDKKLTDSGAVIKVYRGTGVVGTYTIPECLPLTAWWYGVFTLDVRQGQQELHEGIRYLPPALSRPGTETFSTAVDSSQWNPFFLVEVYQVVTGIRITSGSVDGLHYAWTGVPGGRGGHFAPVRDTTNFIAPITSNSIYTKCPEGHYTFGFTRWSATDPHMRMYCARFEGMPTSWGTCQNRGVGANGATCPPSSAMVGFRYKGNGNNPHSKMPQIWCCEFPAMSMTEKIDYCPEEN